MACSKPNGGNFKALVKNNNILNSKTFNSLKKSIQVHIINIM